MEKVQLQTKNTVGSRTACVGGEVGGRCESMKAGNIYEMEFIKDDTEIFIRQGEGFNVLAHGNWYEDKILDYADMEAESFTWQDDNKVYIDVK